MGNNRQKPVAAILVDYDYYRDNILVRDFVYRRKGRASLVALVSEPDAQHPDNDPNEFDWDVVISNHKGHKDAQFKQDSLDALARYSNLYPAVAIDYFNEGIYDDAGTLVVFGPSHFG